MGAFDLYQCMRTAVPTCVGRTMDKETKETIDRLRKTVGDTDLLVAMFQVMPPFWLHETIREVERLTRKC